MKTVVVREFAKLTTCQVEPTLDQATVSKSAFDWLCRLASQFRTSGAQLLEIAGAQWLRLDNFVGILQTPCGTTIEILPKHHDAESSMELSRALLARMIQAALNLPRRETGTADIALFKAPFSEWVHRQFLHALEQLMRRGMKFDYLRVEAEQRHMIGQLDVVRQLRQTPDRAHYFHTRHDTFSLDMPENRLIKSALLRVSKSTNDAVNWRISHELLQVLAEIPPSRSISQDFKGWRHGRLMAQYAPILPWCQLVLGQYVPMAVKGEWHGMSLLFPMEKLFERYVEATLRRNLPNAVKIASQSRSAYLCEHAGKAFFQLRPDLVLEYAGRRIVVDAKWKRINEKLTDKRYGIAQSNFYQLFAYGHKYITGDHPQKELILVYPRTSKFTEPLAPFSFSPNMTLWVLPFEMGNTSGEEKLVTPDQIHFLQSLPSAVECQA